MEQYIALLRAVNVTGKNIIKMRELTIALTNDSFIDVKTSIQSGNIVLRSPFSAKQTEDRISQVIMNNFNLTIMTFVFTPEELQKIYLDNPFSKDLAPNHVFIAFLNETVPTSISSIMGPKKFYPEEYFVKKNLIYYYLPSGSARAKLSNSLFEKKLNILSTSRNINTITKLIEQTTKR